MKILYRIFCISVLALTLASCSNEKDNLTEAIEDGWDMIQDDVEDHAEKYLEDLADNPVELYKGDCEASYVSLGDIFTLTIPIDYTSRAAVGLLFGNDAAELLSLMDESNRSNKSKSEVKQLIMKHFNPSWAGMMTALVILDGEFDYDFESESWTDASYEFDSKALYKILDEKGYFTGYN